MKEGGCSTQQNGSTRFQRVVSGILAGHMADMRPAIGTLRLVGSPKVRAGCANQHAGSVRSHFPSCFLMLLVLTNLLQIVLPFSLAAHGIPLHVGTRFKSSVNISAETPVLPRQPLTPRHHE